MSDLRRIGDGVPVPAHAWHGRAGIGLAGVGLGVLGLSLLVPFQGWAPVAVAAGLYGCAAAAILLNRTAARSARTFGAANWITLARFGGVAIFAGLAIEPARLAADPDGDMAWWVLAGALVLLALDGVDGWVARSTGTTSRFGARFDMEVDALFVLVLGLIVAGSGNAGMWVLGIGLMRYGFLAAGWIWPVLARPLPDSFRRKTVCVVQVVVLMALLAPPVVPPLSTALAAGALGLLVWSFAVDIRWLVARRGA